MKRRFKSLSIFSFLVFFHFSFVLAENEKLEIKSGTNKFENLIFSIPQGSQHTGELLVSNLGDKDLNLILYIAPDENTTLIEAIKKKEGNDLFLNSFFYADVPPSKYQEELKNNGGEIAILCEKYKNSKDKAIKNWCKGTRMVTLFLKKGETKRVPFTISISAKSKEHKAFISAILNLDKNNEKEILKQVQLTYKIPQKEIKTEEKKEIENVKFESFSFKRSFSFWDIFSWWRAGRREEYTANFSILNGENRELSTNLFVKVKPYFSAEKIYNFDLMIKNGENQENLKIKMPFFGKTKIVGGVKVSDEDEIKEFLTEELEFLIFPIREIFVFLILASVVFLVMWRRKKSLNNLLDGEKWVRYKIKNGDNVINLAYLYGISWKELVNFNQIKPPYTVIFQ